MWYLLIAEKQLQEVFFKTTHIIHTVSSKELRTKESLQDKLYGLKQ